ncbi:MAG: hypothetical protein ACRDVL_00185 [Acidimicrobiia bacterium]
MVAASVVVGDAVVIEVVGSDVAPVVHAATTKVMITRVLFTKR